MIDPKQAIMAKMMGEQMPAAPPPQQQMAQNTQGFADIPPQILDMATKAYLEQYGDEGYGGDASMEAIEGIARDIMVDMEHSKAEEAYDTDPRQMDVPPEDAEYSNLPRQGEQAYIKNAPYRRNGEGPPRNFDKMRQGMDNPASNRASTFDDADRVADLYGNATNHDSGMRRINAYNTNALSKSPEEQILMKILGGMR